MIKEIIKEGVTLLHDDEIQNMFREQALDPLLIYITNKLYPYFVFSAIVLLLLVILLAMTLGLLLLKKSSL